MLNKLAMMKIYKTTFANSSRVLKIFLFFASLFFFNQGLKSQVTLTASVGTAAGSFTTLKGAFDAINVGIHRGVIVISINANTTETATAVLNSSGIGSASYTSVLIAPTANNLIISGNLSAADIIQLYGADNVTIDGNRSGGATNLTIINTSATGLPGVIWLSCASSSNGATNNVIKNCNITGNASTTTFCAIMSSGTSFGAVAETANSGNSYLNNVINQCTDGIVLTGPTGNESGNIISGNTITNTSFQSIAIFQQQGVSVTGNTITGNNSAVSGNGFANTGISLGEYFRGKYRQK